MAMWRLMPAACLTTVVFVGYCGTAMAGNDPLPSWNDGAVTQSITTFVEKVTTEGGADFVPPSERIAVFDNDGTLWAEQPNYVPGFFLLDRIKAMASQHPEWKEQQPFASSLKGDLKGALGGGLKELEQLVMATHAGMTSEEFDQIVKDLLTTAKHPRFKRPYTEVVCQPMFELLTFLRANGFKTCIASAEGANLCGHGLRRSTTFRLNRSSAAASKPNSNDRTAARPSSVSEA